MDKKSVKLDIENVKITLQWIGIMLHCQMSLDATLDMIYVNQRK